MWVSRRAMVASGASSSASAGASGKNIDISNTELFPSLNPK
jgi:hypothetical protein